MDRFVQKMDKSLINTEGLSFLPYCGAKMVQPTH